MRINSAVQDTVVDIVKMKICLYGLEHDQFFLLNYIYICIYIYIYKLFQKNWYNFIIYKLNQFLISNFTVMSFLQYFGNMRYTSPAPDALVRSCDVKLAWYSPNVTHWIYFYELEHSLRIHSFMPTWPCLIVKVLSTWTKFLQPSDYYCHVVSHWDDRNKINTIPCSN